MKSSIWLIFVVSLAWPKFHGLDGALIAYCVISVVGSFICRTLSDPRSRDLKGGEDRRSEIALSIWFLLALLLGAFDVGRLRFGEVIPEAVRWSAIGFVVFAYLVRFSSIYENRFFAGVLVIQTEREHRVVDRGPYRIVRHPGNLSALLIAIALPFCMGSILAMVPAFFAAMVVLRRTGIEDRFLLARLSGYETYASRVKFRLVPGLY